MSFANATPYAAADIPHVAPDGREVVIAIVKATFVGVGDGSTRIADLQRPIRLGDVVYEPDAEQSSVRYPGDICVEKRGTDLVVVGNAMSAKPVTVMDVAVSARGVTVPLRVHGERVFYRGGFGIAIGPAAPFVEKPIVYERAWGGTSADRSVVERRNPVGRGVARSVSELIDTPAPQVEHPAHPITGADARPGPVGFGAIPAHWLPRSDFLGTLDASWKRFRMPLMPIDYDVRAANVAHPNLQFDPPLTEGDAIRILGMTPLEVWQAKLPATRIVIEARFDGVGTMRVVPPLDTVLIEPARGILELGFRATFATGRGRRVLREIRVDSDG